MTSRIPILPQQDIGELLGAGVGKGLSQGMKMLAEQKIHQMKQGQTSLSDSVDYLNKYGGDTVKEMSPKQKLKIASNVQKAIMGGYDPAESVVGALEQDLASQEEGKAAGILGQLFQQAPQALPGPMGILLDAARGSGPLASKDEVKESFSEKLGRVKENLSKEKLISNPFKDFAQDLSGETGSEAYKKGVQSRAFGKLNAALKGQGFKDYTKATALNSTNFWKQLAHIGGQMTADLPLMGAGGTAGATVGALGGPIGAVVGGGAGALAFPELLDAGLTEYLKATDEGFKGSFGDYLQSFENVAQKTVKAGASGALLGTLSKLSPVLSKVKSTKPLMEITGSKQAAKALDTAIKSGIMTGAEAIAEQRAPTGKDFAQNALLFLGFDAFEKAGSAGIKLKEKVTESGIDPQKFSESIKEDISAKNVDVENPKEMANAINRVIRAEKAPPEVKTEKITRTFKERGVEEPIRRQQILEDQTKYSKDVKRIHKEVAGERERISERDEKSSRKGPQALEAEAEIKRDAQKVLPEAKEQFNRIEKEVNRIKDELSVAEKKSSPSVEHLQREVKRAETLKEFYKLKYDKARYEAKKGSKYNSPKEIKLRATNNAESLQESIKNRSVEDIVKKNSLAELAKEYKNRREIPGSETLPRDTNIKIQDEYKKAYEERLKDVEKALEVATGEKESAYKKEKDVLEKLIKNLTGKRLVHRRRQALQDIGKTIERAKKVKSKSKEGPKKAEKVKVAAEKRFDNWKKERLDKAKSPKEKSEWRKAFEAVEKSESLAKETQKDLGEVIKEQKEKIDSQQPKKKTAESIKKQNNLLVDNIKRLARGRGIKIGVGYTVTSSMIHTIIEEITGKDVPVTPTRIISGLFSITKVLEALNMNEDSRPYFYASLKKSGTKPDRIKKIKKTVNALS